MEVCSNVMLSGGRMCHICDDPSKPEGRKFVLRRAGFGTCLLLGDGASTPDEDGECIRAHEDRHRQKDQRDGLHQVVCCLAGQHKSKSDTVSRKVSR